LEIEIIDEFFDTWADLWCEDLEMPSGFDLIFDFDLILDESNAC
jgi:hypothetical protein